MKRAVHLHGALKDRFGGPYMLAVGSPAEAVRALQANFPGFRAAVLDGSFHVVMRTPRSETFLGPDELALGLGRSELHIIPVIAGAKSGAGIGKIVLGLTLVAAAFIFAPAAPVFAGGAGFAAGGTGAVGAAVGGTGLGAFVFGSAVTYGNIALFGATLAFAGISQLIAPSPKANYGDRERPDQRPSFLFNGPVNTTEQGGPVPLAFGRFRLGSQVISAGMVSEAA